MTKTKNLAKIAAEGIMGWISEHWSRGYMHDGTCGIFAYYDANGGQIMPTDDWQPTTDQGAWQLDLIEQKLVELGLKIVTNSAYGQAKIDAYNYGITIHDKDIMGWTVNKFILTKEYDITQIRETRLQAYCDAWEQMEKLK